MRREIETTQEELEFYERIREICGDQGIDPEDVLYKDTVNYFNVSYRQPTKWFLRFFTAGKRKSVVTLVPVEEAKQFAQGFDVDQSPGVFGISRVFIENVSQVPKLGSLVLQSLKVAQSGTRNSESKQ